MRVVCWKCIVALILVLFVFLGMIGCVVPGVNSPTESTNNSSSQWKEDDVLKILIIGNSFSHDTMEYVWQIADETLEEEIKLGVMYVGSCTLAQHAQNAKQNVAAYEYSVNTNGRWTMSPGQKLLNVVRSDNWDVILLQQASKHSGLSSTYNEDLEYLIQFARDLCPGAQLMWNMTWAYPKGSPNSGMAYYDYDNELMYQKIIAAVQEKIVPDQRFAKIIPAGTAIQNASEAGYHKQMYRDDCHLSIPFGRYTAGLTLAAAILDVSPEDVTWAPDGLTQEQVQIAKTAAQNAIDNPFAVTKTTK